MQMAINSLARLITIQFMLSAAAIAQNNFVGSCAAFQQTLAQRGVTDSNGKPHPGDDGITTHHYIIDSLTFTDEKKLDLKGTSISDVCYSARAAVQISVKNVSSILTWTPNPKACDCSCQTKIDQWQQQVKAHEQQHVEETERFVRQLNLQFASYPVQSCVPLLGQPSYLDRLKELWARDLQAKIEQSAAEMQLQQDKIDARAPAPAITVPSCATCAPCAVNQQPTCSQCPAGQIPSAGKCNSLCGTLNSQGYYPACGLTSTQQPVACCSAPNGPGGQTVGICSPYRTSVCTPQ